MKRFALSSIMTVALLLAGQSVYANEVTQNTINNHKVSVNPQIDVAASYNYAITVKTADVKDAGTNSNVYVTLNGANGSSAETLFDKPGYDDFERGDIDTYYISANKDLGEIKSITVRLDGSSKNKQAWFPTSFKVEYNSKTWTFYNTNWIGLDGAETVKLTR